MDLRATPSATPIGIGSRLVGSLFFAFFLGMGLIFEVLVARQTVRDVFIFSWPQAEATVLDSEVTPPQGSHDEPALHVRYTYESGGRRFECDQIKTSVRLLKDSSAYEQAGHFSAGARVPCWVNPRNPAEAVLLRNSPAGALLLLFPLIFVAVGGFGIYAMWRRRSSPAADAGPISARSANPARGARILAVLSGIFLLIGLGVTYATFVRPVQSVLAAKHWPSVPREIVSSRVQAHSGDHGTTYSVDVIYRYAWQGRSFTSNRYEFAAGSSSGYEGKAAVVRQLPPGSRTLCFVDPDDPARAVLVRDFTSGVWFGLFPLLFALFGAGGLIVAARMASRPRSAPAGAFRSEGGSGSTFDGTAGADSPVALPSTASPRTVLFFMLFAALFWNGIVSVFLFNTFSRGWAGVSWFMVLFLIPFTLVGLGLIVGVFYSALTLFNPKPRLTASRAHVSPGEKVEIRWELAGRTTRIRRLRLTFEGREEATYRRGTNTKTDKETFAVIPLTDTDEPAAFSGGTVTLQVPPDAMPSFRTANNKIVWIVRVKGEIPRWPDLNEEFTFTVAPFPLKL